MHSFVILLLALGLPDSSGTTDQVTPAAQSAPGATVQLMPAEKEKRLRQMLPRVANADLQKVLDDPRLILYTEREIPRAYQFFTGGMQGFHSAYYNISANGSEPFGNGNREFPWGHPAGMQRTKGVEVFRFLWLPRDDARQAAPGGLVSQAAQRRRQRRLCVDIPRRRYRRRSAFHDRPRRLRLLVRNARAHCASMAIGMSMSIGRLPQPANWPAASKSYDPTGNRIQNSPTRSTIWRRPFEMKVLTLADKQPAKRTFSSTMGVDSLPPFGDDHLVGELLTSATFKSVAGKAWRESPSGRQTYAPTTEAAFNVVPAKYDAGFVAVDHTSCMRCHDSVSKPVSDFNPGRDWYGHIRGSDGIFSFQPFALESISDNGYGRDVKMRPELEKAGVIAKYDPKRHPESIYQSTEPKTN